MIRRWRGLPGSIVLLCFHALVLTIASGLVMGLLFNAGSWDDHKSPVLTEYGEIVYHSWRQQSHFYDANDRLLSDSESARVRRALLGFGAHSARRSGSRYWEPDAGKPGLRWRNASERWNVLSPGYFSSGPRVPQWFFLPDENLLALYGENGALAGRLGPKGFKAGPEPIEGFTGAIDAPDRNSQSKRFLISDSVALYSISIEPPELCETAPIPANSDDFYEFRYAFWSNDLPWNMGDRFLGWRLDSTIFVHAVAEGLRIDSIAIPPRLMRVVEGDSYFQVHFGAPSEDGHISETSAFTTYDDSEQLILFANRFTGEILSETRPIRERPENRDARETATFVMMTGLFSFQPMPIPVVGAFLTWHIYFNDEPATREERIAGVLHPIRTAPQARRVALWGCLWFLVVHLVGGVIGWSATRRVGAASNVVIFWTHVGLAVGAPVLLLLVFRGPRRRLAEPPPPNRAGMLTDLPLEV